MNNCEAGCPCNNFDCNLSLNVTDPVIGLEYLGVFETTGKKLPLINENLSRVENFERVNSFIKDLRITENVWT